MKCAVVDSETGQVLNVIVADPEHDSVPDGLLLVGVPHMQPVDHRWEYRDGKFVPSVALVSEMAEQRYEWNEETGHFEPNEELRAEIEAAAKEAQEDESWPSSSS